MNPNYAEAYFNRGNAKRELGRTEEGIKDYDQAIRINPDYADVYYQRSVAKSVLALFHEARADINKALDLEPAHQLSRKFLKHLDELHDDRHALVAVEKRVIFDETVKKPNGFVDNAFV